MTSLLDDFNVREEILKGVSDFWKSVTKGVKNSTKSALTIDSGRRIDSSSFKTVKDFGKGNVMCGSL